ncbi:MAG: glycosyltransferase, partial [Proteobacteria bacterium]|nr:glycosyltransferase [Pseudomonadota bacterium]
PRVLILCPYPLGISPGQRFRFEQYLDILRANGVVIEIQSFLDMDTMRILYKPGHVLKKVTNVLAGFLRRVAGLRRVFDYDYIFIHREATPIGPPFIEAALFLLRRTVIFDFDDAIFISKTSKVNRIVAFAKWSSKIRFISKHSTKVAVCNNYLVNWVKQYNPNAVLLPTTIDLNYHKPIAKTSPSTRRPVIGWTGTQSTMVYLELVREALVELQKRYDFEFRVICDVDPKFPELKNYRFIKWNLESEIENLAGMDVGLMPVPQGQWEQGKVGFKAIQYSGVAAVPVVSSTGSGHEVVLQGKTGFVVDNNCADWVEALAALLYNPAQLEAMGAAAREYIDT